ncbi:hypothetical protein KEM52_001891 [Ascosphaera acerosa]|nr:hypothetical protein KEM52_001891 [Ascosphaera acerosa]
MKVKNLVPRRIQRRGDAYVTYQEKTGDWADSLNSLLDRLEEAAAASPRNAAFFRTTAHGMHLLRAQITSACHVHRRWLRRSLKLQARYCADPTAWAMDLVGNQSLATFTEVLEAFDPRPVNAREISRLTGYPEKKLARQLEDMRLLRDDLYAGRQIAFLAALRRARAGLLSDPLRMKQLEQMSPFARVMGHLMGVMGSARGFVFDQDKAEAARASSSAAAAAAAAAQPSQDADVAKVHELPSQSAANQPFLRFFYDSRAALQDFAVSYDEWIELSWARLNLEEAIPELKHLPSDASTAAQLDAAEDHHHHHQHGDRSPSDNRLQDQEYRDQVFTDWANMHFTLTGNWGLVLTPDMFMTNAELAAREQAANPAPVPITSAAAYQLQQAARAAAAARAGEHVASSDEARLKLKKVKDATRAAFLTGDTPMARYSGGHNHSQSHHSRPGRAATGSDAPNGRIAGASSPSKHTSANAAAPHSGASQSSQSAAPPPARSRSGAQSQTAAASTHTTPSSAPAGPETAVSSVASLFSARGLGSALRNMFAPAAAPAPVPAAPPGPNPSAPAVADAAQLAPIPGPFTYRAYQGADGKPVVLHYLTNLQDAEKICSLILSEANAAVASGAEPAIGFDMEWRMHATLKSPLTDNVSVIQLATPARVAVIHLSRFAKRKTPQDLLAPSLRALMESAAIVKCGVNIKADCTRLTRVLRVVPQNIYEVSLLFRLDKYRDADDRVQMMSRRPVALALQVEEVLGCAMDKSGGVRMSDWSKRLAYKQIEYAASDAFAHLKLFEVLDARRQALLPPVDRPTMTLQAVPAKRETTAATTPDRPSRILNATATSTSSDSRSKYGSNTDLVRAPRTSTETSQSESQASYSPSASSSSSYSSSGFDTDEYNAQRRAEAIARSRAKARAHNKPVPKRRQSTTLPSKAKKVAAPE